MKRFLIAADNHGGLACPAAVKKFLDFSASWKPHYRIHLGDLWDFTPLRKGASQEEKADGIKDDYIMGLEFLDAYRPQYLTLGNHDDRIWQTATHCVDGMMRESCMKVVADIESITRKLKIQVAKYHVGSYLQLPEGGPRLIHGFRSTLYPAKAHYENWGASICGHVHKPDTYVGRHISGGMAMASACLADLNRLSYADRCPAKLGWRNGWIYGLINEKTGAWHAWHVVKEGSDWISPMGVL